MKKNQLLTKAKPAISAVCEGCEDSCVMPVQTQNHPSRGFVSFIVCETRSDVNRVHVAPERLVRWRCTIDAVCAFVATDLGLRRSQEVTTGGPLNIGMVRGEKRSQMLALSFNKGLKLLVGDQAILLIDTVDFRGGSFVVDADLVHRMVNATPPADSRHTPSTIKREAGKLASQAMYASWQKAYRALKKKHPQQSDTWCALEIAKTAIAQGRSAGTIKKKMIA
jgi:hypothetical protein